jgi:hypothetical protein
MLKSRMEIGEQKDISKALCTCGHTASEHYWPDGMCLHQDKDGECLCARFERVNPKDSE